MMKDSRGCATGAGRGREEKAIYSSAKHVRNIRIGHELSEQ